MINKYYIYKHIFINICNYILYIETTNIIYIMI